MTNNKTKKAPPAAQKPGAGAAVANRSAQRRPGGGPAPAVAAAAPNLDETIAKAQKGRVNVTPAKAIEMAGQLYSRGQYRAGGTRLPSDHLSAARQCGCP